ncbi:ras-related protein RABC1-like [Magnolia sinica]|uniref:ras-related protein RABC1-like n=1 Tax=Magnolia sinica TaxID=86752 RepID=UPI0026580DEC|nr:ras-related protein RABC1-like [Magnolia sinica]
MLVGNKVDKESGRVAMKKEGIDFAREYGCLFLECSAKTRINVQQCFEELVLKVHTLSTFIFILFQDDHVDMEKVVLGICDGRVV